MLKFDRGSGMLLSLSMAKVQLRRELEKPDFRVCDVRAL